MEVLVRSSNDGATIVASNGTPEALDLTDYAGRYVKIFCKTDAIWFNFAAVSTSPTLTRTGDNAAETANIADSFDAGSIGVQRVVPKDAPFLIVEPAVNASQVIIVKPTSGPIPGY